MSVTTVDAHRDQMLAHLERGNVYGFLTMAEPYLRVCPDDAYVRLMTVREYLKLGLVPPAREAVEQAGGTGAALADEFAALRASLDRVEATPLPWSDLQWVFEGNLEALRRRGFDVDPMVQAWANRSDRFQRFVDVHGHTQVRRRDADGAWWWEPAIRDHVRADAAQPLPDGVGGSMPGPYVFDGLGQGGFFERVYRATQDTFLGFSCALIVVEPDAALLAMVLHLNDWREILQDERVKIFTGADWAERLGRAWEEDFDLPFPTQVVSTGRRDASQSARLMATIRSAAEATEQAVAGTRKVLEERYASRDLGYWARRFDDALSGRGEPLRILAAVSTHTTFLQYSMRDARRAFETLGHRCVVLTEEKCYQITSPRRFHEAMCALDPDLFFVIDHVRAEFGEVLPRNLPMLTWDQDQLPHVMTRENLRRVAPHDFLVGCSKRSCVGLGMDPRQVRAALIPTCPEQFGGAPLTDEERERFTCDVSFVSHASQTPKAFHDQERRLYQDAVVQRLMDVMFELLPGVLAEHHVPSGFVSALVLQEAMRRTGVRSLPPELEARFREWYLWRLGDRLFRHEALAWAAAWAQRTGRTLRIYGRGWETHPTLAAYAAGPAENGRELVCIYRASRINLQLMPAGFLHQRALDGLAAGGFFLVRKTPRDVTGRALRRTVQRARELGVVDTPALLGCTDPTVRAGLDAVLGAAWIERMQSEGTDVWAYLRMLAETPYPDELFPRYDEIVFDSMESFAETADRFIDDERRRAAVAREMREIVVRELSYQPMMQRFLSWMRDYLVERAGDRSAPQS